MEILWLSLVAIPVLALIALWEHRFSKGEWLKDDDLCDPKKYKACPRCKGGGTFSEHPDDPDPCPDCRDGAVRIDGSHP